MKSFLRNGTRGGGEWSANVGIGIAKFFCYNLLSHFVQMHADQLLWPMLLTIRNCERATTERKRNYEHWHGTAQYSTIQQTHDAHALAPAMLAFHLRCTFIKAFNIRMQASLLFLNHNNDSTRNKVGWCEEGSRRAKHTRTLLTYLYFSLALLLSRCITTVNANLAQPIP